jgi:hypothetical protein
MTIVLDTEQYEDVVDDLANDSAEEQSVAESDEPQPSDAPEDEQPADNDADAKQDVLNQIWNAEMRCRGKEAIIEDLKEQLKEAKAQYERSINELRKLASDGISPLPLFDTQKNSNPQAADHAEEPVDDSWRLRPFSELFNEVEIKGLGNMKRDAFCDAISTFGDFEDLRTAASKDGCHISHLLPTGFGNAIADQIEEAYLTAITAPQPNDAGGDDAESVDPDDDQYEDVDSL